MKLAKNHIDVGLFSNRREEQLAFLRRSSAYRPNLSPKYTFSWSMR